MKKVIIGAVLVIGIISCLFANAGFYPMTTVVCEVDYEANTVVCSDFNENLWCFYGCEDWQTGDICSMIMFDNRTKNIKDDKIIMVKYDGYVK